MRILSRRSYAATLAFLTAAGAMAGACSRKDPAAREAREHLRASLGGAAPRPATSRAAREIEKDVRQFYERADYWPAWFDGTRPKAGWDDLLRTFERVQKQGLDPEAYDLDDLRARRGQAQKTGLLRRESFAPAEVAAIDVELTRAFLRCASHLSRGELTPDAVHEEWTGQPRALDRVAALEEALRSGEIEEALVKLAPTHPGYTRLVTALESAPPERRRQIELNLDRWRWLPADLGTRFIVVNIPSYELRLFEDGRQTMQMRVVVGKKFDPTPVFSDEMTYVTLNPAWNVPATILTEEILPALKDDRDYLAKHDMELVKDKEVVDIGDVDLDDPKSFVLRQRPGPANPLGQVKFVFPNQFDVYLHDTPADALFARTERAFSHGCVRVEKPLDLAAQLLRDQPRWDRAAIEKAIATGEEQSVTLAKPLPVHIVYWTAWVENDGSLHFADDVYGHDKTQTVALDRARTRLERHASN